MLMPALREGNLTPAGPESSPKGLQNAAGRLGSLDPPAGHQDMRPRLRDPGKPVPPPAFGLQGPQGHRQG